MSYKDPVLIGCDPELFAKNTVTGKFVSVHNLLHGNKKTPAKVPYGAVQVDGVSAEFNINPAGTYKDFLHNIRSVSGFMEKIIQMGDSNLVLEAAPTATFDEEYFNQLPASAKELGCEPDYNAWKDGEANKKPETKEPFRTGSGHVHISGGLSQYDPTTLVRLLDTTLGVSERAWDADTKRKELYGNYGAYRGKPYGVEYRTLSNAWLRDDRTVAFVFDTTKKVADFRGYSDKLHRASGNLYTSFKNVAYKDKSQDVFLAHNKLLSSNGIPTIYDYLTSNEIAESFNRATKS